MATVRGGDIRQVTIDGREFDAAAGSSWTYKLGGFDNETTINGNGVLTVTQRRMTAGIGDAAISIDPERGDLEFIQALKNSGRAVPVTMTLADNSTYSGSLVVTGETQANAGDGQTTLELRGSTFERI
jgi:hypothetical protein